MEYGYVRVSTISQNIDRQMDEMYRLGLNNKQIYIDKQSGKDFNQKIPKIKTQTKKNDLLLLSQ